MLTFIFGDILMKKSIVEDKKKKYYDNNKAGHQNTINKGKYKKKALILFLSHVNQR